MAKIRKPDRLDLEMRRCEELGFGVHYGRYKAKYPNEFPDTVEILEDRKAEEPPVKKKSAPPSRMCGICGAVFPARNKRRYCSPECAREANLRNQRALYYKNHPQSGQSGRRKKTTE